MVADPYVEELAGYIHWYCLEFLNEFMVFVHYPILSRWSLVVGRGNPCWGSLKVRERRKELESVKYKPEDLMKEDDGEQKKRALGRPFRSLLGSCHIRLQVNNPKPNMICWLGPREPASRIWDQESVSNIPKQPQLHHDGF